MLLNSLAINVVFSLILSGFIFIFKTLLKSSIKEYCIIKKAVLENIITIVSRFFLATPKTSDNSEGNNEIFHSINFNQKYNF